jgi:diguanylate cyclase (GGDEF)-like protein
MKLLRISEKWNPLLIGAGFVLILLLGALDYVTRYELAFSLFYLLPIALIAWRGGRWFGLFGALLGAVVWLVASIPAGKVYTNQFVMYWNTSMRFINFALFAMLISFLTEAMVRLDALSRTDPLTGVANSRAFTEFLKTEIDRALRFQRPITLAYFDLDNFKSVNDVFGHAAGDAALRSVVSAISTNIRRTDLLGRLGGDEFALMLPETDMLAARTVVDKIRLEIEREMASRKWAVTLSVGSQTLRDENLEPDDFIKAADDLMYEAKSNGKNKAVFSASLPQKKTSMVAKGPADQERSPILQDPRSVIGKQS